jgi:hypothetical protein
MKCTLGLGQLLPDPAGAVATGVMVADCHGLAAELRPRRGQGSLRGRRWGSLLRFFFGLEI